MLLHACFALERRGHHMGRVMVAIAAQIVNGHFRIRNRIPDQSLDFRGGHGHSKNPYNPWAIYVGSQPSWAARRSWRDIRRRPSSVKSRPVSVRPMTRAGTPAAPAALRSAVESAVVTT